MANPKHLEILKQGVEVWNQWRVENPGIAPDPGRPDLRKADLSGADLRGANLFHANLFAANLSGASLTEADLSKANLIGADLIGITLIGADLSKADLSKADLIGAILVGADLKWANLSHANLSEAGLLGADLRKADLSETNLSGASLGGTGFGHTDLSKCSGLEEVWHLGESHLDPGTVLRSGGLPEAFLRGVGWPERMIEHWSSIAEQGSQFYSCFISYSHEDKSFARRLHDQLQGKGIRCWLDEHQLLPGDDLKDMIDRGIRIWDKVLLCCSEASLTSWWIDQEIEKAIQKEERLWKERGEKTLAIIPLNMDGYLFEGWESGQKSMITRRLAADFVGWELDNAKFEEQLEKVVKALSTDELVRGVPPEPRL